MEGIHRNTWQAGKVASREQAQGVCSYSEGRGAWLVVFWGAG